MSNASGEIDATPQSVADEQIVAASSLARRELLDEMPADRYEAIVEETLHLIERRFASMQKLRDVRALNINPFLMLAMAPAYNIYSPFEAAEYMQYAKMPHGDATAFGKFVEDRVFPLFGVGSPIEKQQQPNLYSAIDAEMTVDGVRYLTTWKSGPWTMNQAHANEMSASFPAIHQARREPIILGIFYGTHEQLNNKPALVRRNSGDYFHVLVGAELWEFVTGVRDAHMKVLDAIREAQARFAVAHGGKTFHEHMIQSRLALSDSFRASFELTGANEDMWEMIFRKAF